MIYTTNWIERLQKDFRRVTRMRGAMPDEGSVIVLMGMVIVSTAQIIVPFQIKKSRPPVY
jgi:transposase-like protein